MANRFDPPLRIRDATHSIVYRNDREFAGWPFIGGLWRTAAGHFVLGFDKKPSDYADPKDVNHDEVAKVGPQSVVIRSEDQGRTWNPDTLQVLFDRSIDEVENFAGAPEDYSGLPPIDFTDADVLIASSATPDYCRPHSRVWIRVSTDGGHSWRPPILLPHVGLSGLSGHGSAVVRPDGVSLVFLTAISPDGWKRRPVVFASFADGANWTFLSFITPNQDDGAAESDRSKPLRFGAHRYMYPRPIMLPDAGILCAVRCQRDPTSLLWSEMFQSDDGGRTWRFLSRINDWGAPADLVRMHDGRIACVYGYRLPPFGIRARLSEDDGRTWGRELILRDDGGSWDLGYPRLIERKPGTLMAIYYMNCKDDPIQMNGGVRHIAQTVFSPDTA